MEGAWRLPWDIVISGWLVTLYFKYTSGCKESTRLQPHFWQPLFHKRHLHLCMVMVSLKPLTPSPPGAPSVLCSPPVLWMGVHEHCSSQELLSPQAQFYLSYGFGFQYHPERLQLPIQKGRIKVGAHYLNAILCQPSWISQLFFTR